MAKERHLKNAPIAEALVDLRVQLPSDFDVSAFSSINESIQDEYPSIEELKTFHGIMSIASGKPTTEVLDKGHIGYRVTSADGLNIGQFRNDGFTFSRLAPYISWEDTHKRTEKLWEKYISVTNPEAVTRIALRFINRLIINTPEKDFSRYLLNPPSVPEGLPNTVSGFLTRLTIDDIDNEITAHVTQALEPSVHANQLTVLLDIDVFKADRFKIGENQITEVLNNLRITKNRIFFNSITEETAELFE